MARIASYILVAIISVVLYEYMTDAIDANGMRKIASTLESLRFLDPETHK